MVAGAAGREAVADNSCASFSASAGVIVKPGAMERAGSVERNHLVHAAKGASSAGPAMERRRSAFYPNVSDSAPSFRQEFGWQIGQDRRQRIVPIGDITTETSAILLRRRVAALRA